MKRTGSWLLGLALAGTGCLGLPTGGDESKPLPQPAAAPAPPPVLPGAVEAANYQQIYHQLKVELDQAQQDAPPAVPAAPGEPKP